MIHFRPIQHSSHLATALAIFVVGMLTLGSNSSHGTGFGQYDPRAMALGGTGVAMGGHQQGHWYNPALSAFHQGAKHLTNDGRHSFPLLSAQVSHGADTAQQVLREDLEGQVSDAIDRFNLNPGPPSARAGERAALDLRQAMAELSTQEVYLDLFAGYAVTVPSDRHGSAFFLGTRALGGALTTIAPDDLRLLDDYISALRYLQTDGAEGMPHPELFDVDGQLMDLSQEIRSSAAGRALLITELGVSGARQVALAGQTFALGAAPKVVRTRAFDQHWHVTDGLFESSEDRLNRLHLDVDLGLALPVGANMRLGASVKDLLHRPMRRVRVGGLYQGAGYQVGMDLDLRAHSALAPELRRRDLSLGFEWHTARGLALRSGVRHDLNAHYASSLSLGLGIALGRWAALDVAYQFSRDDQGGALQWSMYH